MAARKLQLKLLKDEPKAYGSDLLKTRKGRSKGRPLDTKNTMHLILRSTKAKGEWSFWKPENKKNIRKIISKFSHKYGIKVISMANVGNHLHFQIKLTNRYTFNPFIRAITAAIAMAVSQTSRWNPLDKRLNKKNPLAPKTKDHFWDYRPYTRVVLGLRSYLNLKDYILINQLEGFGFQKPQARFFLAWNQLKILENSS